MAFSKRISLCFVAMLALSLSFNVLSRPKDKPRRGAKDKPGRGAKDRPRKRPGPESKSRVISIEAMKRRGEEPQYLSELVTRKTPGHAVQVEANIKGAKVLYLFVTNGGDSYACDHVVWMYPTLRGSAGKKSLTELKWEYAKAGWKEPHVNLSVEKTELTVDGKKVKEGIGTHSISAIVYRLPEGYDKFEAKAGLERMGVEQEGGSTVQFVVFTQRPSPAQLRMMGVTDLPVIHEGDRDPAPKPVAAKPAPPPQHLGDPATDPVAKARQKYDELIQRNTLRVFENAKKLQNEYLEALKTEMKRVGSTSVRAKALQKIHDSVATGIGLSLKKTDPFAAEFIARADRILKAKKGDDIKVTQSYIKHLKKKKEECRSAKDLVNSMRFEREGEWAEGLLLALKEDRPLVAKPAPPPKPEPEPKLEQPRGLAALILSFDKRSANAVTDLSGQGNHLRVSGVEFVPGIAGECIRTGPKTEAVIKHTKALSFDANVGYTVSLWAKPDNPVTGKYQTIFAKSRDKGKWYGLWINPKGHWCYGVSSGNMVGPRATGEWQHIVLMQWREQKKRFLIVDGQFVGTGVSADSSGTGDVNIGGWKDEPFSGMIDEILVFKHALPPKTIKLLRRIGLQGQQLEAYEK